MIFIHKLNPSIQQCAKQLGGSHILAEKWVCLFLRKACFIEKCFKCFSVFLLSHNTLTSSDFSKRRL